MKTVQVNLRLEPSLVRELEDAAREESLERGTLMRKLLIEALREWRLEHALKLYQRGEISLGRVVQDSGRSYWELLEMIPARGIAIPFDADLAVAQARVVMQKLGRVAEPTLAYDAPSSRPESATRAAGSKRARGGGDSKTLPDFAPRPGGVLLVGINPATRSVKRGHYYQGKLGQRLWKRLGALGLLKDAMPGLEDEAFVAAGHGLTDVVKRATDSADQLARDELRAGAELLRAKVREWKPKLVLFAFKQAAVAALGTREVTAGACGKLEGVPAFLLSGPYAAAADATRIDAELKRLLAR
ncbi:MAG: hypothetical protein HOP12_01170 [Candidatus Eisenbacteria bacterium]|uniref:Uracil-DNA glycosylase-like domain-containing protein n=1 Tax=Eiseniibacteriota bacterium TaxID=2212470 RepID=A0A849SAR1_UNCEI|nr:hypothetical protein [Candidatus Eisenbacteria bacterium]